VNGIVGVVVALVLLKQKNKGKYLSLLYFGYNFTESLITNLSLFPNFSISPLFTTGLMLSIALLIID